MQNPTISYDDIERIVYTEHRDPYTVLGPHLYSQDDGSHGIVIRGFLPDSEQAWVIDLESYRTFQMTCYHQEGFYEVVIPGKRNLFKYKLRKQMSNGEIFDFYDSYSFLPSLSDFDLHLISEGNHHVVYEKLGAHKRIIEGVGGIAFSVWAPNALRVSVVGDFNGWDGRQHPMRMLGGSGIWEIFIPGIEIGQRYKFEIKTYHNSLLLKADPYAFFAERRPDTASICWSLDRYNWSDNEWMEKRRLSDPRVKPVSILEVHLGSFMRVPEQGNRFLTYRELAIRIVDYVKQTGYTHVELLPVMEHPYDQSWGYQVTGFFAPTSRHGHPEDFMAMVDYFHQNDIGVILDWVPAHFPKDAHGLGRFDGSAVYEHSDSRQGEHLDWDTYIFNYGRVEVRNFLIASALFWLDKYHIDGLRVDAVASMLYLDYSRPHDQWVPNKYGGRENLEAIEFLKYLNSVCKNYYPGALVIAEESTSWPGVSKPLEDGGLGFDFKWNMGWMHDTLEYFSKDPIYRKFHHNQLTFPLLYAFTENFTLVFSHDEVVHGKYSLINKMPGDTWQQFANLRLLLSFMWSMPGKKLVFSGQDFGQWNEWNCNQSLDWDLLHYSQHGGMKTLVSELNKLYRELPALHVGDCDSAGFQWLDFSDSERSVVAWTRFGESQDEMVMVVCNFTPMVYENYRVPVPRHCDWQEFFNSDAELFGGSGKGNCGGYWSDEGRFKGFPASLNLTLPPLSCLMFKPRV